MDLLEAVLLGLVQGLTEFLPVSSSGHLVMAAALLGDRDEGILFEIAVHAGTLVAILAFYRRRVVELIVGSLRRELDSLRYVGKLLVATLPAAAVGLTLREFVEGLFSQTWVVGVALLVTGGFLMTTRRTLLSASAPEPSWAQALWVGCAQALAIVPGISRSGATVAAGLALGVAPLAATEFSFLMGVAAISGATLLGVLDVRAATGAELESFAVGAVVAAVSGLGALWLFVRLLRSRRFHQFAYYCWAVGGALLLWSALL